MVLQVPATASRYILSDPGLVSPQEEQPYAVGLKQVRQFEWQAKHSPESPKKPAGHWARQVLLYKYKPELQERQKVVKFWQVPQLKSQGVHVRGFPITVYPEVHRTQVVDEVEDM